MFVGLTLFSALFPLAVFIGVIIFAVKLIGRLKDISESQKSIADSHTQLVKLLISNQQKSDSSGV
ncbi:hypothetical protein C9I43_01355 [Shewanella morhuae]|uniref:Uncharacterized protein n=1 Tax=Shewanella morhuae TaxID=365591 RepID=A0A1N6ZYW5_9GAMM|nr:hypothetical protein [Shewanella morhuae]PTA49268.1 hypothetical protein C9I43_01355 [Shewanella morhuae]GIU04033.1 hypothetical protein TUM4641_11220 [Shewanella morhuae]SIR32005.1 hypothetical protein SAMN05421840_11577 [Shewanella morhuae]SUI93564.1 Uncharacterised protein [Shewanella morhuae]